MGSKLWQCFVFLPIAFSLLNFLPLPPYWFEEFNRFWAAYYLGQHLLCFVALVFFASSWSRRKKFFTLAVLFGLILGYSKIFAPFFWPRTDIALQQSEAALSAQQFNFLSVYLQGEIDTLELGKVISSQDAGIVAIQGIDSEASISLSKLFPYNEFIPGADGRGLGIYSRFPPRSLDLTSVGEGLPPVLGITLVLPDDRLLQVVTFRAFEPWSRLDYHRSRMMVRRFSTAYRHSDTNVIVAGSLGSGHYSYSYLRLKKAGRFKDAMHGFGLWATWDNLRPWLRVTTDHILYRGSLAVRDYKTIPLVGQAHRAVVARMVLTQ